MIIDNALAITIISWITIMIVGIIKDFDLFNKIKKNLRRPIYLIIDSILAFGLSALYFAIFKIEFNTIFIHFSIKSISITLSLYALYENTKLKDLVAIGKEKLVKAIGKNIIDAQVQKIVNDSNAKLIENNDEHNNQQNDVGAN